MKCLREKGQGPRIDQYFLRSQSSQSNEIQRQEANHSSQDISTPVIDVRRTCMDTVSDEPNDPCEPEQELPQASLSCGDGGFGPRAAAEGDEETSPEAEPTLSLVSEARKGGEEPERAEGGALEVDPLPEVQRGQETGPRPSIEGPVPVTEGAQEEPLKQLLPRASLSGGGAGSGPCAAVGGETEAVPVTDAEAGEGPERVYPLSLGEGGEGPERVDPLPSRAEGGPETVPRTSKEGPRAGKTRPSGSAAYAERPSVPPKSRVQTVPARVPPPISPAASPGGGALGESVKIKIRRNALTHQRTSEGGKGEKAPEVAGPSAPPKSAPGEKAAEWTVVARRKKKVAARSTGEAKRGETKPTAAPSGGGSGEVPDKETPSTAPPTRQGGKAARKTKHLIPTGGEEKSAAGGELPVAVTRQGTASGSIRGKRKAQARLPTCARKCTRTGLTVGVPGGAKEGPLKPKRPPRRPPSAGNEGPGPRNATERVNDPSPEVVRGSAEEAAEPMEEAPAERPKGREEPVRADGALRVDPLPVTKEASEADPDSSTEGPAAAEGSEGGEEPPQEQDLPQASLSRGAGGFGPRAAAEGDEETPPEAEAGSAQPALTLVSGARKGGEEPERAEGGALEVDPLPEVQRGQETGPQGPVPVTEEAREEPLKEQPPQASGPRAAVGGETEAVPVTDAEEGEGPERVYPLSLGEGGEGPERVDPLPSRAEGGPETVPRTSKEGPRAGTKPSGSATYAERPSAPPKSRVQTVPARVPPPVSPAASTGGGAQGGPVKLKIRRNALTHQRDWVVKDMWNFPLCIAALDGKHIVNEPPPNSGCHYFNYTGLHPIVLMALVDAELKFSYVDVGTNGRMSDSGVWAKCGLSSALESNELNLPPPECLPGQKSKVPYVVVADEAFAFKSYLMKPYPRANLDEQTRIFNYHLSSASR
ncbi:UNVERIFIED_CONTAM: hypothetical protein FKN15_008191 [Acipenser sinensis]